MAMYGGKDEPPVVILSELSPRPDSTKEPFGLFLGSLLADQLVSQEM